MTTSVIHPINVKTTMSRSWEGFKANAGTFILGILSLMVFYIVSYMLAYSLGGTSFENGITSTNFKGNIILLPYYIFSILYGINMTRIAVRLAYDRNYHASFKDYFNTDRILLAVVLSFIVAIIETLGFLLLVIPGIFAMLVLPYAMVAYFKENLDIGAALKRSYAVSMPNLGANFLLGVLSFIFTIVIGILTLGIGLIVVAPWISLWTGYAFAQAVPDTNSYDEVPVADEFSSQPVTGTDTVVHSDNPYSDPAL